MQAPELRARVARATGLPLARLRLVAGSRTLPEVGALGLQSEGEPLVHYALILSSFSSKSKQTRCSRWWRADWWTCLLRSWRLAAGGQTTMTRKQRQALGCRTMPHHGRGAHWRGRSTGQIALNSSFLRVYASALDTLVMQARARRTACVPVKYTESAAMDLGLSAGVAVPFTSRDAI